MPTFDTADEAINWLADSEIAAELLRQLRKAEAEIERLERVGRRADIAEAAVSRAYRLLSNISPTWKQANDGKWVREATDVLREASSLATGGGES